MAILYLIVACSMINDTIWAKAVLMYLTEISVGHLSETKAFAWRRLQQDTPVNIKSL